MSKTEYSSTKKHSIVELEKEIYTYFSKLLTNSTVFSEGAVTLTYQDLFLRKSWYVGSWSSWVRTKISIPIQMKNNEKTNQAYKGH